MKIKFKIVIIPIVLIIITVAGAFLLIPQKKDYKKDLQFTTVEKGNLKNVVSCTGTIKAKGTVEIGTQVSGTVAKVYADFNDSVKKEQILAKLDTTLLEISVMQGESELAKAKSQYEHDQKNYENNLQLHDQKLVSDYDFEAIKVTRDSSYSAKLTAETNLKKAKSNLSYAIIRSPIDGIVIDRDIEEGQTIAASLSSPTLFKIAEDLSNMQISALVDENDIGKIKLNQKVTFTVESYPEEEFSGAVTQIRLEPTTVSNVVNYTVIISAKNSKHLLLPGMTTTLDITIEEKNDVFLVSNSALKFKPTLNMLPKIKNNNQQIQKNTNSSVPSNSNFPPPNQNNSNSNNTSQQLWYLDNENNLKFIPVKTGLTDGQKTEIIENPEIKNGLKIITGTNSTEQTGTTTKTQSNQQMGPPPMF